MESEKPTQEVKKEENSNPQNESNDQYPFKNKLESRRNYFGDLQNEKYYTNFCKIKIFFHFEDFYSQIFFYSILFYNNIFFF